MNTAVIVVVAIVIFILVSAGIYFGLSSSESPSPSPSVQESPSSDQESPSPDQESPSVILPVLGCTDTNASNFSPEAEEDDGSCIVMGCMDSTSTNFNPGATEDDGSCTFINTFNFKSADGGVCLGKDPANEITYYRAPSDNFECYGFNITTDKDGNITDTSQEIKINDGTTDYCAKFNLNKYLIRSSCDSPDAYTFSVDDVGIINVNNTSSEGVSDNIRKIGSIVHKNKSWVTQFEDPPLEGKFVLKA